ncbi:MAG: hypothetical protein REI93_12565, partial [Pedobacter sp.]|nr:hypothetical protein [Pedobacter sp.]
MKNFTIPSPFKKAVFTVFVAAMGMLSISWTEDKEEVTPNQQSASYQVINQKAFIAGAGKLKDWKSEVSNFDCTGQFVAQQGELGSISDFSFSLNIADLNNAKEGSELQK